jgi:hypothetical protein
LITTVVGVWFCIVVVHLYVSFNYSSWWNLHQSDPKRAIQGSNSFLFEILEAYGRDYLKWSIDAKSYISTEELDGILESPTPGDLPTTSKWKAVSF